MTAVPRERPRDLHARRSRGELIGRERGVARAEVDGAAVIAAMPPPEPIALY